MGVDLSEKTLRESLKKWFSANIKDRVEFIALPKSQVDSDIDELNASEESAKSALDDFLTSNIKTQVVVVESGADSSDCDCKDECTEKIEETVFRFSYEIQKLYDNVHMRTSYFGRNMRNDAGVSQVDSVAVTLDEYDIFFRFCKEAAANVYTVISASSNELDKAFLFNNEDSGEIIYLYAKRKRSWNLNLANSLDVLIETAMIYYIMAKWFETLSLEREYEKYMTNYFDSIAQIKEQGRNLKMKKAKRKYRYL